MIPKAVELSQAIASAEGFYVPNSLPARCHNPGDLEMGDVGCGVDHEKTIFPNDEAGWLALQHQCALMLSGSPHTVYKLTDRIIDVALRYTGNDSPTTWASAVAQKLGISAMTTLGEFLNGPHTGD